MIPWIGVKYLKQEVQATNEGLAVHRATWNIEKELNGGQKDYPCL